MWEHFGAVQRLYGILAMRKGWSIFFDETKARLPNGALPDCPECRALDVKDDFCSRCRGLGWIIPADVARVARQIAYEQDPSCIASDFVDPSP